MPFERFGNIIVGSTVWEPGLGVRATGISCVARSSELRAVRVDNRAEAHCNSPHSFPGGFAPIMTVLKLKNAVGVDAHGHAHRVLLRVYGEGLKRQYAHLFPRLPVLRACDRFNVLCRGLYILLLVICQQLTVGCDPAVFAATGCCLL
jgi:hypothetical protein